MRPRPASPFRARGARPSSGTLGRAASLAAPESRWRAVRERWGERLSASRASGRRSWTVPAAAAAARQWAMPYRWAARRAGKWPAAAASTSRPVPRVLPRCALVSYSYGARRASGALLAFLVAGGDGWGGELGGLRLRLLARSDGKECDPCRPGAARGEGDCWRLGALARLHLLPASVWLGRRRE